MTSAAHPSAVLCAVPGRETPERAWWREAVFYQVYPRSFADGNGDGIGDLVGIIGRLDYLAELGIDAIWLSPHYPSPLADLGYDVTDYMGVHPDYGTFADFRTLLAAAHAQGIRIVIDLVLNHTSDQHPWFVESRSSRDNPRRDWYVWEDARDDGPPNNWMAQFGGSAWELDPATSQYYYHCFLREQPDLNFRNREVRAAITEVMRFWLELGVDGFRLDAPDAAFEDPTLVDHTEPRSLSDLRRGWITATGDAERAELEARLATMFAHQLDQPEVHGLMRELRAVVDAYHDRVLIGETDQIAYYGSGSDELHLAFNFPLMRSSWLTPAVVRRNLIERWAAIPDGAWDAITLGNHDEPRVRGRFGPEADDLATARLAAALVLTLPGTPFLYYGEEIGMTDLLFDDAAHFRDNWGLWLHRAAVDELGLSAPEAVSAAAHHGRDKARTPMHWSSSANGGFSPAGIVTWLPVNGDHAAGINVEEQRKDPGSLLQLYRRLIEVRRHHAALSRGGCTLLATDALDCLAYLRSVEGQACLVVLNMTGRARSIELGLPDGELRLLVSTGARSPIEDARDTIRLEAYEAYVAELVPALPPRGGHAPRASLVSRRVDGAHDRRRACQTGHMTDDAPTIMPTARLAASRAAFAAIHPRVAAGEPWPLAQDAGNGPEASWGPREVLAHLAEMLPYWLGEYERIVEADRRPGDGLPFGRLADDPVRQGILERDRTVPLGELFARIDLWIERWEHRLAAAPPGEGAAVGRHPARGEMTGDEVRDRMVLAHLEDHLGQLEQILADR